jgi:hypothetical protein
MQGPKVLIAEMGMPPPRLIFRGRRHEEDNDHQMWAQFFNRTPLSIGDLSPSSRVTAAGVTGKRDVTELASLVKET